VKTHFILVMLAGEALFCGAGYAAQAAADKPPDQTGHALAKRQRSRRGGLVRPLPKPLPKRPAHVPLAGAMNPLQGSGAPSATARSSLIPNPTGGRRPAVRSLGPAGPAASPLRNVRHRSPNPAIVAGSADLGKRNTGAIDGDQVHRRP